MRHETAAEPAGFRRVPVTVKETRAAGWTRLVGPAGRLSPHGYATVSLHDHHYLDPDGLPVRHHNQQVIEARTDDVDRIHYLASAEAVKVDVLEGGHWAAPLRPVREGLHAMDILLRRPLAEGETIPLRYETAFRSGVAMAPWFRRTISAPVEGLAMRVEFHREKIPRKVWWDGIDGEISEREPVPLSGDRSVHRFLRTAEDTVIGFTWQW